jgi:MFS family permease
MHNHGRTIGVFGWNGFRYGMAGGALVGTLILPLIGTFIGCIWGMIAGLGVGLVVGAGAAAYNSLYLTYATDLTDYRRRLTLSAGIATGLLTLLAMALFWGITVQLTVPGADVFGWVWRYTALFGLPAAPVAGLSIAYAAHDYANRYVAHLTKLKRDHPLVMDDNASDEDVGDFMRRGLFRKAGWLVPLLGFGGLATNGAGGLIGTILWGFMAIGLTSSLTSSLIRMLNRVYFDEYVPDLPLSAYKNRLSVAVGLTTLIYCVVISGFWLVPLTASFAVWTARQYADTRYETPEKAKNKAKNDAAGARLQLGDHEDDNPFAAEQADAEQVYRQP